MKYLKSKSSFIFPPMAFIGHFTGQVVIFWALKVFLSSSQTFLPLYSSLSPALSVPHLMIQHNWLSPCYAGSREPGQHGTKRKGKLKKEETVGGQGISDHKIDPLLARVTGSENNSKSKAPKIFWGKWFFWRTREI